MNFLKLLFCITLQCVVVTASQASSGMSAVQAENTETTYVGLLRKRKIQELTYSVWITIVFDDFPEESGWKLEDLTLGGSTVERSPGTYANRTSIEEVFKLPAGHTYRFTMLDSGGNGLGAGGYFVSYDDVVLASGQGDFGFEESNTFFLPPEDGATLSPTVDSTPAPSDLPVEGPSNTTSVPSSFPSDMPSLMPSTAPTIGSFSSDMPSLMPSTIPTVGSSSPIDPLPANPTEPPPPPVEKPPSAILVIVLFDDYASEIGWKITDIETGEVVAAEEAGTYPDGTDQFEETIDLVEGRFYAFWISDSFGDGLCCDTEGSYTIKYGNQVLAFFEGNFGSSNYYVFKMPAGAPPVTPAPAPVTTPPTLAPMPVAPETLPPTDGTATVNIYIEFDDSPWEIGWFIEDVMAGEKVVEKLFGTYTVNTPIDEAVELSVGKLYMFAIEDSVGNGFCCPSGLFEVRLGDQVLGSGSGDWGGFQFVEFTIPEGYPAPSAPTGPPLMGLGDSIPVNITMQLTLDDFPGDTGWYIRDLQTSLIWFRKPIGTYTVPQENIEQQVEVYADQEYEFVIEDATGDGLCCYTPGAYVLRAPEGVITFGKGDFGATASAVFTVSA